MPRKPNNQPIACEFFVWRLLTRDRVFYADGRTNTVNLGKHSLGTRDRDEALKNLRKLDLQKAIELGKAKAEKVVGSATISIADGWKLFLDFSTRSPILGGVSSSSYKRYRAVRDKHLEFCSKQGILAWNEFNKSSIEAYANQLSKEYADRTIYFELTLLKSVIHWLIRGEYLPAVCDLHYSLRKPQGTSTYCYSSAEVWAMIKHCQDEPDLAWLGHVIFVLAHTGLRISELGGLRWGDVNLDQNMIHIADERANRHKRTAGPARTTKGRRSRAIPVHPELRNLLATLPRKTDGYVLHAAKGGRLHARNVLEAFIDGVIEPLKGTFPTLAGDVGFEHGRLHSFRHFFTSQAFLSGVSEGEIREWLGHADSKMVEHYRHLRSEDAQRKMSQVDFLGRQDTGHGDVA
jgi:integrase